MSVFVWRDSSQVAGVAQVVLGREHERAGRAHGDAVAAVDAGGVGQRVGVLGRDAGVEAAPGDRDRERVLVLLAAGVDALVAEDALGVIAHVQVVVDLGRRVHGGRGLAVGALVVAGGLWSRSRVRRRGRPVALGIGVVALEVVLRRRA